MEVVRAQVRLIDDLLTNRLGKSLGFADPGVVTLDPAVGTGTYLLGVIDHALSKGRVPARGRSRSRAGDRAWPRISTASRLWSGLLPSPSLRVSRALESKGARLPAGGTHVYLTDTLESPDTPPPSFRFFSSQLPTSTRKL